MGDIELDVRFKDWLSILVIGIVFGALLAMLGYRLLDVSLAEGVLFGAWVGFCITLFSLMFVTSMNRYLLPAVDHRFWAPLAILFSFLSGFLGTLCAVGLGIYTDPLMTPSYFKEAPFEIASAIGALTYVVGALIYRFVRMRNEKEALTRQLVESRLRSLETQLNPHFLFNALNSVAELIHTDPPKAEEAVLTISTFLRNTMQESALIPLANEVANAKAYLELENIRYSSGIEAHWEGLEAAGGVRVPKFSIQLLIENALKHGMTRDRRTLRIDVRYRDGIIEVANDGVPMRTPSYGVGLSNLRERLERLCQGRLVIASNAPVTFEIHLGECHDLSDR